MRLEAALARTHASDDSRCFNLAQLPGLKPGAINDITSCLRAGASAPEVGIHFPLAKIVEAHEAMESSGLNGKIIVDVLDGRG